MPKGRMMTAGVILMLLGVALAAFWLLRPSPLKTWVTLPGGRSYAIDLPAEPRDARLILVLHGGAGRPAQIARNSGFSARALGLGYAVAYPSGSGRFGLLTWNAGYCCGYAQRENIDDLAFLNAVADDARTRFGLSPMPVFITGMSNGAMMAEAFAALYPAQVQAAAGVSGTLDLARFAPKGAVPLLVIHGTADENIRYDGGFGRKSWARADFTPVDAVLQAFALAWGPGLTHSDTNSGPVARRDWSVQGRIVLSRLRLVGGGHLWPGGTRAARQGDASGLSATTEILRFFDRHR